MRNRAPAAAAGFTYTTRRGKHYYLHTGPKRGGGVQHFLSTKAEGPLAAALPEGFEIYETVNGLAFLRRQRISAIHDTEVACVRRELATYRGPSLYEIEVADEMIVIHEADVALGDSSAFAALRPAFVHLAVARCDAHFMPMMRFVLVDKARRWFSPERFCFRGSVDDWISIGGAAMIAPLALKFIPHLGRESFYELF